jgi:predicted oxidoreductase
MKSSTVIAGCMNWGQWGANFNTQQYLSQIKKSLEIGISTFDHADIYGHYTTEEEFGNALKLEPSLRDKMQIITKCGICMVTPNRPLHQIKSYNTSKTHILASVEKSLENFNTDYIDLLLIHRPDPLMNPHEIAEAFSVLKQSGKVRQFGVSNFTVSQFSVLHNIFPLTVNQVELSIIHTRPFYDGITDQCIDLNVVPQAWSPMGAGKIHLDAEDERSRRIISMANILGDKYNASFDQILIAWLLKHPSGITPVLGTTKIERLQVALDSHSIELTNEEWHMLLRASNGFDVP